MSICSIITLCFNAALLKASVLIRKGTDHFCRVSRRIPCPYEQCERLSSHVFRMGNLFCVCSLVQNNTFPLSRFFRFMVHLPFSSIKYRNLKMVAGVGFEPTRFRTEV